MSQRWAEVELSDIADICGGGRLKLTGRDFVDEGVPAFGAGGMNGRLPIAEFNRAGIVLASTGTCGKCYLADGEWTSLANTQVILPAAESVDIRFLWYQLNDPSRWPISGTAQPFIKPSDVRKHRILLPPLAEQRRIASTLDAADALRTKRRQALEKLDSLTQSIFIDMFGDPLANPRGWPSCRLEEVVEGNAGVKAGPFGSSLLKSDYVLSGYRVYGQEQVISGCLDIGDYFITPEKFESLSSCAVAPGDILVSLVGSFGKVLVVPSTAAPGIINPRLLRIRPDRDRVRPHYLSTLLISSAVQRFLGSAAHGGTMGVLNATLIKQVPVMVPPIEAQIDFERALESVQHAQRQSLQSSSAIDALLASLQHRAFWGEL
jgi:type I restriction enzyme S subunit